MAMMRNAGGFVSNNLGAGIVSTGTPQQNVMPRYLGSAYDFSGTTIPGFYNINPETFPFYAMRNQLSQGMYTPGSPTYVPYNMDNPTAPAGIRGPGGQMLYSINANTSSGMPNDPLVQEYLRRSSTMGTPGGRSINTNPAAYASPAAYNQAMRQYAAAETAAGRPLMAYFNPQYSLPRRAMISNNARGLLTT